MGTSGGLIEKLQLIMFCLYVHLKMCFELPDRYDFSNFIWYFKIHTFSDFFYKKNLPFWNIFVYFDIYSLCWNNNKSKNWLSLKTDDFTTGISFYLTICRLQKLGFKNKYYCPLNSWQKEFIEFIIITWL